MNDENSDITFHFVYRTFHLHSNKFYIGRHSTKNVFDGYRGSGKWIRSLKDKSVNNLNTEVLCWADTPEELLLKEAFYLNYYINWDGCMNFNTSPCGFSSGELNPSKSLERRKQMSENHWSKTDAGRQYM